MKLAPAVPIFRIFDLALAKRFYIDWLGFTVDWEHQFSPTSPHYLQVSRDGTKLHLSEHYGDSTPGSKAFIEIDDVTAFHDELKSRPNPNMNPGIATAPWRAKILDVIDPFGNRICFNQSLP